MAVKIWNGYCLKSGHIGKRISYTDHFEFIQSTSDYMQIVSVKFILKPADKLGVSSRALFFHFENVNEEDIWTNTLLNKLKGSLPVIKIPDKNIY